MKALILALKGVFIGIANVIPGVSGGTIALILGVFDDIIVALKKIDLRFLVPLGIGVGLAIAGASKIIPPLMKDYPSELAALFIGLILGSIPVPYREMGRYRLAEALFLLLGIAGGYVFVLTTSHAPAAGTSGAAAAAPVATSAVFLGYMVLCGFLSTCAMILPGISGSALLVLLGQYRTVFLSISIMVSTETRAVFRAGQRNSEIAPGDSLLIVVAFGIGALVAFVGFIRLLDMLLKRWRPQTMALLIGLMLGAMPGVWPEKGGRFTLWGLALLLVGITLALLSEKFSKKHGKEMGI